MVIYKSEVIIMQEVDPKQTDLTNTVQKKIKKIYNYYYLIVGQLHKQPHCTTNIQPKRQLEKRAV